MKTFSIPPFYLYLFVKKTFLGNYSTNYSTNYPTNYNIKKILTRRDKI